MSDDNARLIRLSVMATLVALVLVLLDVNRTGLNVLNLIQPGEDGPSAAIVHEDFPDDEFPDGLGLDGQQFYAVARNPLDLDQAAESLDRPRYRLQRPLLSWLGWLLHPTGGGPGLVVALLVVNIVATAVLAYASGALSASLGGPVWIAALVGFYPGVLWSLRVTTADLLATALAVAALALLVRGRQRAGVTAAGLSVLARETAILVFVGWLAAGRRDRSRWVAVAVAGAIVVGWAAFLRWRLPGEEAIGELTWPFAGYVDAVQDRWLHGRELRGLLGAVTGVGVGIAAVVRRRLHHPLAAAVLLQFAFLAVANGDVVGNDFGSGRAMLPLLSLGMIMLLSPGSVPARQADVPAEVDIA